MMGNDESSWSMGGMCRKQQLCCKASGKMYDKERLWEMMTHDG